jgi:membrane-bound serine protease (ClpP class)
MKRIGFGVLIGLFCGMAIPAAQVGLIKVDGAIGPATASYISRALNVAAAQTDQCLIIELNTPGGLTDSMNDIVQAFYASPVPTVVYVAPEGAMAGSAGCYITLAAEVAAMAPHTTIGAAHPVELGGGGGETTNSIMMQKMGNAYAKVIENIASKRHRNVEWAKSAVIESAAITAEEALASNVVDLIATNLPDLLAQINGREINGKTLHTAGATVVEIPRSATEKMFQLLWRPEVMMLLMLIAIYGIIGELNSPGAILPGVAGAIALVLLLYMSAILPVNLTGLALILLAVALFVIDMYATTHGILTAGGIVAFFLGSLMLFSGAGPGFQLPLVWIISATAVTAAFFIFVVGKGVRAQFRPVQAGAETMLGQTVPAVTRIDADGGRVFIEGETWNAVSPVPVAAGQPVEVTGINGLTLSVKPKN